MLMYVTPNALQGNRVDSPRAQAVSADQGRRVGLLCNQRGTRTKHQRGEVEKWTVTRARCAAASAGCDFGGNGADRVYFERD